MGWTKRYIELIDAGIEESTAITVIQNLRKKHEELSRNARSQPKSSEEIN
jgi:hypothetical protein